MLCWQDCLALLAGCVLVADGSPPTADTSTPSILASSLSALNTDFCPWANRWVYWLKHPFWVVLVAVLAAIACGVLVSTQVLALGLAMAVCLAWGVAYPWLCVRGLTGRLRYGKVRVQENETVTLEIEVENHCPWPVWGLQLSGGISADDGSDQHAPLVIPMLGGWSRRTISFKWRPAVRGVYPRGPARLQTAFPFGLYAAKTKIAVENSLIVWPGQARLEELPDAIEFESREDRTSSQRAGDAGDILGTRPFRPGDLLRRVHWAQSARHGELVVCERQLPVSCALRLVIDLDPAHHSGSGADSSLNRVLRVAASLLGSMHRQHAQIECRVGNQEFLINGGQQSLQRCLDALAAVPEGGREACSTHGLCCHAPGRHRAVTEYLLTTSSGFASLMHDSHWAPHHHYIVVRTASSAEATLREPLREAGCHCRPWLETSDRADLLAELPTLWRRACRVA